MNPMSASVIISHFISVLEKCISFVWILQCAFRGKFSPSFFCPDSVPAQEMRWFMFWDRWFWKDVRDVPWGWNLHLVPLICTRHRLCALYNSAGFINGWWIISVHSPNYFWLFLGPEPRKMSLESSQHGNPTASLPLAFSDPLELGSWHWKKKKEDFWSCCNGFSVSFKILFTSSLLKAHLLCYQYWRQWRHPWGLGSVTPKPAVRF